MIKWVALGVIALAALSGCGSGNNPQATAPGRQKDAPPPPAPRPPPPPQGPILSSAFPHGSLIPAQFTCDGKGAAPPLEWTQPLAGTQSFALVVDDPDAPGGTFYHWGAYDVPVTARSIVGGRAPGRTLANDFAKPGYGPPCPPPGTGLHHYRFKLYGMKVSHLDLKPGARIADLQAAVHQAAVAGNVRTESMLIGYYERK